jgi:glycosyltransferase involved in cell wall biosynthesis
MRQQAGRAADLRTHAAQYRGHGAQVGLRSHATHQRRDSRYRWPSTYPEALGEIESEGGPSHGVSATELFEHRRLVVPHGGQGFPGVADLSMTARPPVAFVSWSFVRGRSAEIASALDGEAKSIYYTWMVGRRKWFVPFRYIVSSLHTIGYLVRRRPRSVIATLPPVFPGLVAWMYSRVAGAHFVLDSHPSGFGRKGDRISQRLLPVHRWLSRRADATMVTTHEWVQQVEEWGGNGIIVHEAPALLDVGPPPTASEAFVVLFVAVFSGDEPVAEVVEAVRGVDCIRLRITGDTRRCAPELVEGAPDNVEFVGFLGPDEYRRVVEDAHIVLALTTEPTSVMRAAYEAVYARRPLVTSDWPRIRELFDHAVFVSNSADGIGRGLIRATQSYSDLVGASSSAFDEQTRRWDCQLSELRNALGLDFSESI